MLLLKNLTASELLDKLREHGLSICYDKLKLMIDAGVFGKAAWKIPMSQDEYIILERDIDIWIAEHSVEVEMSADILEFARMQGMM